MANTKSMETNLRTTEQVAELFGVEQETVRIWHRQNKLPGFKPKGVRRLYFKQEDLEAFMAGKECSHAK